MRSNDFGTIRDMRIQEKYEEKFELIRGNFEYSENAWYVRI
jgi:hypothetical protein